MTKITRTIILALAVSALAIPTPTFAAKGAAKAEATAGGKGDPAKRAAHKAAREAIEKFDKNTDGAITGDESAELRKAFDADKTGPLKALDTSADGTLDDNEIAAIKGGKKAGKAKGEGKKKKKNAV